MGARITVTTVIALLSQLGDLTSYRGGRQFLRGRELHVSVSWERRLGL